MPTTLAAPTSVACRSDGQPVMEPERESPYWQAIVGNNWPEIPPSQWNALATSTRDGAAVLDPDGAIAARNGFDNTVRASERLDVVKDEMRVQQARPHEFAEALYAASEMFGSFADLVRRTRNQILDVVDNATRRIQNQKRDDNGDGEIDAQEQAQHRAETQSIIDEARNDVIDIVAAAESSLDSQSSGGIADALGQQDQQAPNPASGQPGPAAPGPPPGTPQTPPQLPWTTPVDMEHPTDLAPDLGALGLDEHVPDGAAPDVVDPGGSSDGGPGEPADTAPPGPITAAPLSTGPSSPGTTGPVDSATGEEPNPNENASDPAGRQGDPASNGAVDREAGADDQSPAADDSADETDSVANSATESSNQAASGSSPGAETTSDVDAGSPTGAVPPVMMPPPAGAAASASAAATPAAPGRPPDSVAADTAQRSQNQVPPSKASPTAGSSSPGTVSAPKTEKAQPLPSHEGQANSGSRSQDEQQPGSEDLVRDAVGAAIASSAAPAFLIGERVDGDLALARSLLGGIRAAVDEHVIGVDWAVSVMRHQGGVSAFVTSNEGRGWLAPGLYLPREISTPWQWSESDGAGWEGVADPARVLAEFALAWGAESGAQLSALVSSAPISQAMRRELGEVAFADSVEANAGMNLGAPAPSLLDRLGSTASQRLLDRTTVPDTSLPVRCLEYAVDAHMRVDRAGFAAAESLGVADTRLRILRALRHAREVPDSWWTELQEVDDLLVATAMPRRADVSRIALGELRSERASGSSDLAIVRELGFHRRCNELLFLLAEGPTRQILRDMVYAHAQIRSHPVFAGHSDAPSNQDRDPVASRPTVTTSQRP